MKFFGALLFLIGIVVTLRAQSAGPDTVARPAQPTHSCDPVVQTPVDYQNCMIAYNTALTAWQENEAILDNLQRNPLTTDASGKLVAPPLVNNCDQLHVVGSPAHATCVTNYNNDVGSAAGATTAINDVKNQMENAAQLSGTHQQLQQQSAAQGAAFTKLETPTDFTVTGSLQQVQTYGKEASNYYTLSAGMLSTYSSFNKDSGDIANGSCSGTNYGPCKQAGADYAAAAAYDDLRAQANAQVIEFGINIAEACKAQNKLSTVQNVCDPTNPASPVFIPGMTTPPSSSWFAPFTGVCSASAPELCSNIYAAINPTGILPTNTQMIRSCPGGGTGCISQMIVTTTPMGIKYTFKNKVGKDFSFYAKDLKDEKSLIKAGLTPDQAKKLLNEVTLTAKKTEQAATTVAGKLPTLKALQLTEPDKNAARNPAAEKPVTVPLVPKQIQPAYRRPSTEGLSKYLNGDLIGVSGDDIFKMINRRYQHKDQQDWFLGI